METQDWINAAIENDKEGLIDGIKSIFNCADVAIDELGRVWIAGPMAGHWLSEDDAARVARALKAGDI